MSLILRTWAAGSSAALLGAVGLGACGGSDTHTVAAAPGVGDVIAAKPLDKTYGWVLSKKGLQTTTDGGKRFTARGPSDVATNAISAVEFLDQSHGWAAARNAGGGVSVRSTNDGGRSWRARGVIAEEPGTEGGSVKLKFVNPTVGFALRALPSSAASSLASLAKTADGGSNWKQLEAPFFGALTVMDPVHLVVTGGPSGSAIAVSGDAGISWTTPIGLPAPSPHAEIVGVANEGSSVALLISRFEGESGPTVLTSYTSTDFGRRWRTDGQSLRVPAGSAAVPVSFTGVGSWVVAAPNGSEVWTSDGKRFSSAKATGLSGTVVEINATAGGHLWARTVESGCTGFKSGCEQIGQLYVSDDTGTSWSRGGVDE